MPSREPARVSAVRDVVVDRPLDDTLAVVRDIAVLEPLERKARAVEIWPETDTTGRYRVTGKLFRLVPWEGTFTYTQHERGWHSEDAEPREDGWRVSGGFLASRIDDTHTRVTHYEDYVLPDHLRRWRWLLERYMRRSQVGEMRDLAALVESRTLTRGAAA